MPGVMLTKGGNVSLTKSAPGLVGVTVGFGWDASSARGVDLDVSALGCDPDNQVLGDEWFVFFNNLTSPDGSITHRAADGDDGDRARIELALGAMTGDVDRITFVVSIYDAETTRLTFDQVRDAYVRVVDRADGAELVRYELGADRAHATALVFGEIYRNAGEWKFRAVGQGYSSGLEGIARDYGVDV